MAIKLDEKPLDVQTLRKSIPQHCFKPNNLLSGWYVVRDLLLASILFALAFQISRIESDLLRICSWITYSILQGFVFTGIWILAHECGHGALFSSSTLNNPIGFTLHSMLLVPFFSWKYTHAVHHRYTNHMEKDTAFVPSQGGNWSHWLVEILEISEDAPIYNALQLLLHQLLGWPLYLLSFISGDYGAVPGTGKEPYKLVSHFDPSSGLFSSAQQPYVLVSDAGILLTIFGLKQLCAISDPTTVMLAYFLPWLWVNHWIVAITYLHHTHIEVPHFDKDRWTFIDGALATVDRDFGFVGKHLFHGIVEYHVIHHLFTRIPFYYAEEATDAIRPMLGHRYRRDTTPLLSALWNTFVTCKVVTEAKDGMLHWAIQKN